MAGWLTALKLVPWGEVVKSAPQIAEGARKLWQSVGSSGTGRRAPLPPDPVPMMAPGREAQALAALGTRVAQLERELAEATGLIHSMAEQDKQLVGQIAHLQRRQRWLWAAVGLLLVLVGALLLGPTPVRG